MKKKACYVFILCLLLAQGANHTKAWENQTDLSYPTDLTTSRRSLSFVEEKAEQAVSEGRQYLLIIGIGAYERWLPLKNPAKDALELRDILTTRYYLDEIIELYDEKATKANILKTFNELALKLKTEDSLLIYYAGHGHFDQKTNTGFWIPYDAGLDTFEQNNWLPNAQIRGVITNMRAIHICLISDSCFAGNILNISRSGSEFPEIARQTGTGNQPLPILQDYFRRGYALISRQVITAGALETVPDSSSFSYMLKRVLAKNINPYLDPFMLFNEIRLGVKETTPLLGSLKETGHQEGASFLFFLRKEYWPEEDPAAMTETAAGFSAPVVSAPQEEIQEKVKSTIKPWFFSLSLGLSIPVPVGDMSTIMETGINPLYCFSYNITGDYGELGFGLFSGISIGATKESFTYQYYLISWPVAFQLKYSFTLIEPLYGFIETNTGLAANLIKYRRPYEKLTDASTFKFFLAPALGLGIRFNPQLRLAAACYYNVIFFDRHLYTGLAPGFCLALTW